uniref:Uncharacterized protein n=1 Tax=Anguilla anguilla TaxID=7936 RepID=A0A0E9XBF8_ANGAN
MLWERPQEKHLKELQTCTACWLGSSLYIKERHEIPADITPNFRPWKQQIPTCHSTKCPLTVVLQGPSHFLTLWKSKCLHTLLRNSPRFMMLRVIA